ncbi:MAG: glycosyl hydrolase-related protein [Anaerolineae bacterium]
MNERLVWAIGSPNGRPEDLIDNNRAPNQVGAVTWRVPRAGETVKQQLPRFHPSEADPEGGYQLHPYTIEFSLDDAPDSAYRLSINYMILAPRLAHLQIGINGVTGWAYLRPTPLLSHDVRVADGLGTCIYAEGVAQIIIPAGLLHPGENRLVLTAHDGGPIIRATSAKRERLGRLASSAGILYQALTLTRLPVEPVAPIAHCEVLPSILYYQNQEGELVERAHVYIELARGIAGVDLSLRLSQGGESECCQFTLPPLSFGHWHETIEVVDGKGPVSYSLFGDIEGHEFRHDGVLHRRRKWKVYVSSQVHAHVGNTHRQWETAERLCRNIDAALDLVQADEAAGGDPAFAYHLDSAWTLETYLTTRDKQHQAQLLWQIEAGRLSIPANEANLSTQFATLEDLIRNGELSESFLRQLDRPAEFAAAVNVASLSGSLPAILEGSGVKYLVHASDPARGPFRLFNRLHLTSPFYWEGPNGGRVLTWLAKTYGELRKVCGSPPLLSAAERGLALWLDEYERAGYTPDAILLYGQEADNIDLDPQPIDFIRQWNATYTYPRLIPCGISEFFQYVAGHFDDKLKTVRGDEGAYGEAGIMSSLAPSISVRRVQAMLPAAERLETLAVLHHPGWAFPQTQYDAAWRSVRLYAEDAWNADLMGRVPDARLQEDRRTGKEQIAREAEAWGTRLLHAAATRHSLSWNTDGREVVVYNPHSWSAGGSFVVEIATNEHILDRISGQSIPMRLLQQFNSLSIVEVWLDPLPGLSYRRLRLTAEKEPGANSESRIQNSEAGVLTLENSFYRLAIDRHRGCVTSWFDKELERELVDVQDAYGFGQFLYARGGDKTRLEEYRPDWPAGNPEVLAEFELRDHRIESHALGATLTLRGRVPQGELDVEWTLPARAKQVDVRYTYHQAKCLTKEAAYIAFPLALPHAGVSSDSQLGWVNWQRDAMAGACKEWLPLQTGILVEGEGASALIASPDISLWTVGDVVRGRWPRELDLTGGRIFSYVLNNYWSANSKASPGGPLSFHYRLTTAPTISRERAYKFGWEARRPLYAQRINLQEFRSVAPPYADSNSGTLAQIEPATVILSTIKKARRADGYIVRLQEISGADRQATLHLPGHLITRAWQTDLLEREQGEIPVEPDGRLRVPVPAWGLATVRVMLDE